MNNAVYSTMLRAGRVTYFVDVRERKSGSKYLTLTKTDLAEAHDRNRVVLEIGNMETAKQLQVAMAEAINVMAEG